MKVVLAGAYGHLGHQVLTSLIDQGHEVVAADKSLAEVEDYEGRYLKKKIDVTDLSSLEGLCDGAEVVISTVGLVRRSKDYTPYDIDYWGNVNLLQIASLAGVKQFIYISVIDACSLPEVPLVDAKYKFEQALKKSSLNYVIHRPTGYFYDIAKVFMPMIDEGKVSLLGRRPRYCNVVDTGDFAAFIVDHMMDHNMTYQIGGRETYSYDELALIFGQAAHKTVTITHMRPAVFDILIRFAKLRRNGSESVLRFSKWTLMNDLIGDTIVGDRSFKEYIYDIYRE